MTTRCIETLSVALVSLAVLAEARAQIDFRAARSLEAADLAEAVVPADFDRDGHIDIVTMSYGDDRVFFFRGDGAFGFLLPQTSDAGGNFAFGKFLVQAADFDEDGILDLVAAKVATNDAVTILLGDGSGGFGAPRPFPSGSRDLRALEIGDFDEDGNLDVAVAGFESQSVSILVGDGHGTLSILTLIGVGQVNDIAVTDLNEDAHLDLCAFTAAGGMRVYLGDGFGEFSLTQSASVSSYDEVPVDWNEDGHIDLYISVEGANDAILLGDGSGQLAPPQPLPFVGTGHTLVASDFDSDGHADVAGVYYPPSWFQVVRGDGAGGGVSERHLLFSGQSRSIAPADLDGDGSVDLITTAWGSGISPDGGGVRVFRNVGASLFEEAPTFATGDDPSFVVAADLNGDGHQDLATANARDDAVSVLLGDGSGFFGAATSYGVGNEPVAVRAADLDGDGNQDLVAANYQGGSISVLLGVGDGSFVGPAQEYSMANQPKNVVIADFDGDGLRDVATPHFWPGGPISIRHGLGGGVLGPVTTVPTGTSLSWLVTADFDEDHVLDFAAIQGYGVRLLFGDGIGGFTLGAAYAVGDYPVALIASDLDGDGHLDLATSNIGESVSILRGDGAGSFGSRIDVVLDRFATHLAAADLDGDGDQDLAVADGTAAVIANDGAMRFSRIRGFVAAGTTQALAIADFDEDGLRDLALAQVSDTVGVLINRSLDPIHCRRGTVNLDAGPLADVLLVNGQAGAGDERRVIVTAGEPFEIRVEATPSQPSGPVPFALFAWPTPPSPGTVRPLPRGIGPIGLPIRLTGGAPQPVRIANSLGFEARLGVERWPGPPTQPAPTVLLSIGSGIGRTGSFYFQGIIRDTSTPGRVAAVTNGIELVANP